MPVREIFSGDLKILSGILMMPRQRKKVVRRTALSAKAGVLAGNFFQGTSHVPLRSKYAPGKRTPHPGASALFPPRKASAPGAFGPLLWKKKRLSPTDLQIPKSSKSNPKGCMTFSKSKFIDPATKKEITGTYFRRKVFGGEVWKTAKPGQKETFVPFDVFVGRRFLGTRTLRITDMPSRKADQGNSTSVLHWGSTKHDISKPALLKKAIFLYRSVSRKTARFVLQIA